MTRVIMAVITGLLCASCADAQEMYDSSVPEHHAVLRQVPSPMIIRFAEDIQLTNLRILGADGTAWPTDWRKSDADVAQIEFRAIELLPPGKYELEWTAWVRQHGHPDGGVIMFEITK